MMRGRRFYSLLAWILSISMLFQATGMTSYASEFTSKDLQFFLEEQEGESQVVSFESEYLIYEVISETEKTVKLIGVNREDFNYDYRYGTPSFEAADITIPATVSHAGVTYDVVEIGEFAFADYTYDLNYQVPLHGDEYVGDNLYVKKITVSDGIKKIGTAAFYRMYILEEVVLPDSVEEIGEAAFCLDTQKIINADITNNTVLKVNIPENIKRINDYTYSGVTFEGTLRIPEGVEYIGEFAFGREEELSNYVVADVPASVNTIGHNAFCNSSLIMAVLRKTTMPQIEFSNGENVYSSMMFGYETVSDLQVYVPANLVNGYNGSTFDSYVSGITFKDIAEYGEDDYNEEPFHYMYQGEKVTELEVRGTDVISVVVDKETLSVSDIQWKLKLIESSCPCITNPEECVSLTHLEDGSISIKILCSETTVQLVGKVPGYKEVVLHIHGLYEGVGDTTWIDRLEALTEEEINSLSTVFSQRGSIEQLNEIRAKAEEITAGCTTDREKIFAIEQWIATYVAYDHDYFDKYREQGISPYEETPIGAYDVYSNRYTVCAGYALLSEVMVRSVGIPCVLIEGIAGGGHAWNAAYDSENQKWIYFDATWDSPSTLQDSQFSVLDTRSVWFDFDPVEEMTKSARYTLWMNIDEKESAYDTSAYVNKHFITLYEGQTEQLEFLNGMGDVTFVIEEEYVEQDADFSQMYEKLEREGRFITVDETGKITALKEGQSVIGVRRENNNYNTWEIYVRVMPWEEIYFGEETYTLSLEENSKLDVFRGKGIWDNSTWGRKAITEFVKLSSSNTDVVKVDEKGNLTPVSVGTATITGHMCFDTHANKIISCNVVVTEEGTVAEEKEEFELDNLVYQILSGPQGENPGTVSVIDQNYRNYESSNSITVTIPEMVVYGGETYKVTVIGKNAFSELIGMASVSIPVSVERIEEKAFYPAAVGTDLTGELIFPENSQLKYIGPFAFAKNEKLAKVDLSNCTKLETIDMWAFAECSYFIIDMQGNEITTGITEVILPESLKVIEQHAFYMCQQLSKINIPGNMDYIGHYAFSSTDLTGVLDLSGVKEIGENIFRENGGMIDGIILNDDWTEIGPFLFRGSGAAWFASRSCLEAIGGTENMQRGDVLLSEKIKQIGEEAFYSNYAIRNIQAPGLESVGEAAFYGCYALESVQAPQVETIGERAFAQCENLKDIDFEQNLKVIPEKAFIKCSQLTDFTLGEELMEIGYGSLYQCSISDSIRIPSEKISYFGQRCFKEGITFYIPKTTSEEYMKELKDYSIAFYDLDGNLLESIFKGIDALLMEYPQYSVGDSYEVIRNAIGVYLEYSDGTIVEIEDYTIEDGTFTEGGQEIEISYHGYTDRIKVGSSPNQQPVWYISPTDPSYSSKVYKTGTSFQQVKDLFILRAYHEDGTYEVIEEYDVWPGTFAEGENWVTFAFCDFVGGAYKIQRFPFTASDEVEEEPVVPDDPEGVVTGIEISINPDSNLSAPVAGYVVGKKDFTVYYNVETGTNTEFVETTNYTIYNGTLELGENTITVIAYDNYGNSFEREVEVFAEACLESLEVQLKNSVKLKAGDTVKSSQFTATASYSGDNGYTTAKEVKDFVIKGNAVLAEGMNVIRFSYTETTRAFGTRTETARWSMCTDDKPVLSAGVLSINQYATEAASFKVYLPFGMTARLDGVFYQNNKGKVQNDIFYLAGEDGRCTIQIPKVMKNKTYPLYVKVLVEETRNEYYVPIKLTLKASLPKITASAEKINIFFTDDNNRTSEITLKNVSSEVIRDVIFEENSAMDQYFDIVFNQEEQTLALKLTDRSVTKDMLVSKGKLLVWLENYNTPAAVNVNISVSDKQPKLKITPSSVNINTKMYDNREAAFEVTMQEGKTYVPVNLEGTIPEVIDGADLLEQVTAKGNIVTLKLKNTDDFNKGKTVKVNLQSENWKMPVTVSYKIKTVNVLPKALLETKFLTLDLRAVGAEANTLLKFDTMPGDLTYKELPEVLTAVKKDESAPVVTLEKVNERTYIVKAVYSEQMQKGTYKYSIVPELSDGTKLKKVTLTVKVTTANKAAGASLKVQKGSKIDLISRASTKYEYKVTPTVMGTYIKEMRLRKVELGNDPVDSSFFEVEVNKQEGVVSSIEISASENGKLIVGEKYKFTFEAVPATVGGEMEASQVSVTISPKESRLQLNANVKTAVLYRNITNTEVLYKLTPKADGVEIGKMEYVPTNKVPEGAFEVTQTDTGAYLIRIADKTKVTAKKSYKLTFKVMAKGGTKAVTQNLTIKVQ